VNFRDLPDSDRPLRARFRANIEFEVEGTIGVNIARVGEQRLGPATFLRGELR
jgi:hypothetical protein